MATQNRAPTGDGTVTGTVTGTAGQRWSLVDDYPNASTADMLTFGTAASAINFTYSPFAIPAGSTSISVQVRYVDGEAANGANNCGGRIVVGGVNQNAATHNPSGTAGTLREDSWATNPATGAAWTVDQVNGVGANALTGFGINSTDSNPTFNIRSIELQVTYTEPAVGINGDSSGSWGGTTGTSDGAVAVVGSSSGSWGSTTGTSDGTVSAGQGIAGDSSGSWGSTTGASTGVVSVAGSSTGSWGSTTGTSAGVVSVVGSSTGSWGSTTGTSTGTVQAGGITGDSTGSWGSTTGVGTGAVAITGSSTGAWGATTGTGTGSSGAPAGNGATTHISIHSLCPPHAIAGMRTVRGRRGR